MLKTPLPDKVQWGRQLRLLIKATGIEQRDIRDMIDMSQPTLRKVLDGNGTHDQLAEIERALMEIAL